jgi:Dockerin type I domain
MKKVLNPQWRSLTCLIIVAVLSLTGFVLSNAFARQKRVSVNSDKVATRNAVTVASAAFTFTTPQVLVRPPILPIPGGLVSLKDQDVEPEIKIDIYGNIYITAIHGVPGGVDLWKSTDKGASFVYLGEPDGAQDRCNVQGTSACTVGAGGGDDSLDVSSGGYLYLASLYLGGTTVSVSKDGGTGGAANTDQAWTVNPASAGIPVNDRQWIAAYGPQTLYMTFDQAPAPGPLWFVKSTDAGKTFSPPTMLTGVSSLSRENNLVVDQYNGNIYTTFTPAGLPNQLKLLKSTDGGANWTTSTIITWPAGTSVENSFPILAVDRGGNLHLAYAKSTNTGPSPARTNCHVYLMSSTDQGATWLAPVQVDSGVENTSAIMPWIVAGSPGVVDVTWYGSTMASPDNVPANQSQWWNVFFAQTTNALGTTPIFTQQQVATGVHDDAICSRGGNCAGSTRDLAEYYTMTIDGDGNAHIAFVDGVNNCIGPPTSNCYAKTWYTKQTAGTTAFAPPPAPPVATFAPNLAVGDPGAEPGLKVDSHNCLFVTAPGNPWVWKSVNNGNSFLPPVNPVADRALSAGDEDILPIPQSSGARPDMLYFVDLATLTSINVAKSTDGGVTWAAPGIGGVGGQVSASSDRQWIAYDHVPTSSDVTVYEIDHEAASEAIRFNALTNDTAWSPPASGMTDPELILPPNSTFPNTNPGPVFVDPRTHMVYGVFNASTVNTNRANPPFGKMPNVWEAVGPAPAAAGAPPGPMVNHPVFKGVFDSPASPQPTPPPGAATFGNNCSNDFPSATIDNAGNIYTVWAMNNARNNEYQVWFASSHDHGNSFYGPFQVSHGPGAAEMPWIAAGDDGRFNVVFYATNATNPDGTPLDPNIAPASTHWYAYMAQSLNAASREPVFTISPVSDHIMHNGGICNLGLLCTLNSGDRSLLDFFQVSIGPDGLSNIIYADNGSSSTHATFARQIAGPLALTSPTSPTCNAAGLNPLSAVSRKTHPGVGDFDVPLPIFGGLGIECRTGPTAGVHKVVVTFPGTITVNGNPKAAVTSGTGTVSNVTVNGAVVTIDLTGVTNAQRIAVTLFSVSDGTNTGDVQIPMGVLAGDTNADRSVNSADITQTKAQSGQAVTKPNFREDLNTDGAIDSADITLVKSKSGSGF